jgi:hypothetical protein
MAVQGTFSSMLGFLEGGVELWDGMPLSNVGLDSQEPLRLLRCSGSHPLPEVADSTMEVETIGGEGGRAVLTEEGLRAELGSKTVVMVHTGQGGGLTPQEPQQGQPLLDALRSLRDQVRSGDEA